MEKLLYYNLHPVCSTLIDEPTFSKFCHVNTAIANPNPNPKPQP